MVVIIFDNSQKINLSALHTVQFSNYHRSIVGEKPAIQMNPGEFLIIDGIWRMIKTVEYSPLTNSQ
jgi:hypothetical protein